MPTPKKKNTAPPAPVKNRNAAIRKSHQNQAAVEDSRDEALQRNSFGTVNGCQLHNVVNCERCAVPVKPTTTSLDISRAPERGQALELAQQLQGLVVTNKTSHAQALEMIRAGKEIKRKITSHWQRITRSIDDLKRTMFGFRDDDLGALDRGLAVAERVVLDFENAERERVRRREEEDRLARERKAVEDRNRELEAAEDRALEIEQQSENLSARELWFVNSVFSNGIDTSNPTAGELRTMLSIAREAGYKKPDVDVARLLRTQKILEAIKGKHDAKAIRDQAAAQRQQPVDVAPALPVESNLASGRGLPTTRTYYSCHVESADKLKEAFLNGEVDRQALIPNETYLNAQARAAKSAEIFERAFPGCRLVKRQGLAG